jgi:hypothetical protein
MSNKNELVTTYSIDSPLEEITMKMVNCPPLGGDAANGAAHHRQVPATIGKKKSTKSKPGKKPTRRRKS